MHARCRLAPLLPLIPVVVLLWAASAATAEAAGVKVKHLERVSPKLDLPQSCLNEGEGPPSSDVEPHIAVNPTDKRNIIATWFIGQEDFRDRAQAGGVAYSKNGGRTWKASVIEGVDACSGGPPDYGDGAHDTWLSFDPTGRAYLLAYAFGPETETFWSLTSDDGGRHWSRPVEIIRTSADIDKPTITADPTRENVAYVVWQENEPPADAYFAVTTDGGRTWSSPRVMYRAAEHLEPAQINEVHVLPDGDLVNVFSAPDATALTPIPGPVKVKAIRSTDGGSSWSESVQIGTQAPPERRFVRQPDGDGIIDLPPFPSSDVSEDGTIRVVWHVRESAATTSRAVISRSADGGRTWTQPRQVGSSNAAFQPSIAAGAGRRLGVQYYDLSADKPGDDEWTAQWMFSSSKDGGRTWRTRRIGRRFDLLRAPIRPERNHSFLGDYTGVARAGGGFAAAFTTSQPFTKQGLSDIWVARLVPQRRR